MKFEVPQRQQLASERTSLTLFAPALSTTSFVPLTRNFSPAAPSPYPGVDRPLRGNCHPLQSIHRLLNVPPVATVKLVNAYQFEKFGTGKGLLLYRIDARYRRRAPVVRDVFSEELGAQNRLLRYGRDIRYQKPPPVVRDAFSGPPVHDPSPPVVRKGYPCVAGGRKTTTREQHNHRSAPPGRRTTSRPQNDHRSTPPGHKRGGHNI